MLRLKVTNYFMVLMDDCTVFCYVYLLKQKNEVFNYLRPRKLEE
jgi:hypothetical protein